MIRCCNGMFGLIWRSHGGFSAAENARLVILVVKALSDDFSC